VASPLVLARATGVIKNGVARRLPCNRFLSRPAGSGRSRSKRSVDRFDLVARANARNLKSRTFDIANLHRGTRRRFVSLKVQSRKCVLSCSSRTAPRRGIAMPWAFALCRAEDKRPSCTLTSALKISAVECAQECFAAP